MGQSGASLTSGKPPIEKLGFGSLIIDKAPLDPMTTDTMIQPSGLSQNTSDAGSDSMPDGAAEGVMKELVTTYDEAEVGNSLERELFQLTIVHAEIDAALERLEADVVQEEVDGVRTAKKEDLDEEKTKRDEESVDEENGDGEEGNDIKMVKYDHRAESAEEENECCDEEHERNVEGQSGEVVTNLGRHNNGHDRRRINYPMRPDAEDCAYYMKTGSCKFGLNCKFNHPPRRKSQSMKEKLKQREENSEKAGQTECKYYLTSGGCRYGKDCKYSHGSDKSSTSRNLELNFLGLPIRPGEKECPYYMRTGSCKYGSNCRFHHPDPKTVVGAGGSPSGYDNGVPLPSQLISSSPIPSWSSPLAFTDTSPFVPVVFPPTQGAPTTSPEWNGYQALAYPTSERSLPTPPAFAINNLPPETHFPMQHHDMIMEEYPERPGEPECSFFLKTGDCKFKSNCKFHHPKNHNSKAKAKTFALNDKGLPLRPDEPICTHYHRFGICKYGPACKYDHPPKFAIALPSFDEPPYSNVVDGAEQDRPT